MIIVSVRLGPESELGTFPVLYLWPEYTHEKPRPFESSRPSEKYIYHCQLCSLA